MFLRVLYSHFFYIHRNVQQRSVLRWTGETSLRCTWPPIWGVDVISEQFVAVGIYTYRISALHI